MELGGEGGDHPQHRRRHDARRSGQTLQDALPHHQRDHEAEREDPESGKRSPTRPCPRRRLVSATSAAERGGEARPSVVQADADAGTERKHEDYQREGTRHLP